MSYSNFKRLRNPKPKTTIIAEDTPKKQDNTPYFTLTGKFHVICFFFFFGGGGGGGSSANSYRMNVSFRNVRPKFHPETVQATL